MDRLTRDGWELIGTPIEGFAGDPLTLTIEYDEEHKARSLKTVDSHQAVSSKSQGRRTRSFIVWL